jgi:hypothetical protein
VANLKYISIHLSIHPSIFFTFFHCTNHQSPPLHLQGPDADPNSPDLPKLRDALTSHEAAVESLESDKAGKDATVEQATKALNELNDKIALQEAVFEVRKE